MTDLTPFQDFRTAHQKFSQSDVLDLTHWKKSIKSGNELMEEVIKQFTITIDKSIVGNKPPIEETTYEEIELEELNNSTVLQQANEIVSTTLTIPPSLSDEQIQQFKKGIISPEFAYKLRPFQVEGVLYSIEKKKTFIADEMGLGKTLQAIATVHSLKAFPCLIVCPNTLKYNWRNEIQKWIPNNSYFLFTPTNIIGLSTGLVNENTDFHIINYEFLKNSIEDFQTIQYKSIIFDESHYLKNETAARTQLCKKLTKSVEHIFLLTGTPVLNRPTELMSQLKIINKLHEFGGEDGFKRSFCLTGYGGKVIGVKDLDILNFRMRESCYIRRNKKDVLKDLPPKQREIIQLDIDNREEYEIAETSAIYELKNEYSKIGTIDGFLEDSQKRFMANALVRIEVLKHLSARGKLSSICDCITDFIESGEKLVVFAHHIDIQKQLFKYFDEMKSDDFYPTSIFADQDILERQKNQDKFQSDEKCKLIILSLEVGGTGINLTSASNVAFVELGWNPAKHDQAEDRCHRIGQYDSVTAYYFIGNGTIDEDIHALIEKKRVWVDATTEGNNPSKQINILSDLIHKIMRK